MKENSFIDVINHINEVSESSIKNQEEYNKRLIKFNNYYLLLENALKKCKIDTDNFFYEIEKTDFLNHEEDIISEDKSRLEHIVSIELFFDDNPLPLEYTLIMITNHNNIKLTLKSINLDKEKSIEYDLNNTDYVFLKNNIIHLFKELYL